MTADRAFHAFLVQQAKDAIDAVHGDMSVSQGQTLDSLTEIAEHIDPLIETLQQESEDDAPNE